MSRSYDLMMDEVMGIDSEKKYMPSLLPYKPYELENAQRRIRELENEVLRLKSRLYRFGDREIGAVQIDSLDRCE